MPEIKAASGRIIANGKPRSEYVAIMLCMFVCGMDVKKAIVAPLLAPSLLSAIPVGITPHEHRGRGIPAIVAQSTERKFGFAICFIYFSFGTYALRNPAKRKPKSRYGDISFSSEIKGVIWLIECNIEFVKSF